MMKKQKGDERVFMKRKKIQRIYLRHTSNGQKENFYDQ